MAGARPPRDRRIQEARQFREVYQSGKSFHGRLMTLVSMLRSEDCGRVAYVASRKVGPAVKRNRAKRLLREAYRSMSPSVRARPWWRIWIARSSCAAATLGAVSREMEDLLGRESG